MGIEIFINVRPYQTRFSYTENARLKQLLYHQKQKPSLVGALYKGRVIKIIKNLNYAFIDLGLERSGFLYGKNLPDKTQNISKFLKKNQDILVQIKTDPLRDKGSRLSMEISLAGFYLVYLPEHLAKINISKRILDLEERQRLNTIVKNFDDPKTIIVRTFAKEQKEQVLQKDFEQLKNQWTNIQNIFKNQKHVGQILQPEDPLLVFLKNLLSKKIDKIIIDDKESFKKISQWIQILRPNLFKKLEYYTKSTPLFKNFGLESQIQKTQNKKVSLKSGGFLIFEELEAFSVIDVNSGHFVGSKNVASSLLDLNLEAADVIAEQVPLRQLGGIILVDFIDMEDLEDRKRVVARLNSRFKNDPSQAKIFPMAELGMVQITRKRSKNSLLHFMTDVCHTCHGQGRKKTFQNITNDLFLKVESCSSSGFRFLRRNQDIHVSCHPDIKKHIETKELASLEFFKKKLSLNLLLKENSKLQIDTFQIEKL